MNRDDRVASEVQIGKHAVLKITRNAQDGTQRYYLNGLEITVNEYLKIVHEHTQT